MPSPIRHPRRPPSDEGTGAAPGIVHPNDRILVEVSLSRTSAGSDWQGEAAGRSGSGRVAGISSIDGAWVSALPTAMGARASTRRSVSGFRAGNRRPEGPRVFRREIRCRPSVPIIHRVSCPCSCSEREPHVLLMALSLPEAGFASIAYATMAVCRVSSPDARLSALQGSAARHSSRNNKPARPPSTALLRPCGCGVDRIGLIERHRGRDGRGLGNTKTGDYHG